MEELMFGASTTMGFEDRSLGALFCILNMGEIVKEYESEREKLISNRDIVQRKVDTNDNRRQRVNVAVFKWLQDVDKLMEEDRKMEIEMESQSKNCFLWTFFAEDNYHIYDGMQKKMMVLNIKCVFQPFSIHIPSIEKFSQGKLVGLESTEEASDQILEALQDNYIIGLHGIRGTGKTELVKAVGEKAKKLEFFDEVVFVTVSQNSSVFKIQEEIGYQLKLILDRNCEAIRRKNISSELQSCKRNLVILDDFRERIKLQDIGIPYKSTKCKVLLTMRNPQLCTLMDCEKVIPLQPLSEEEAWNLFKKHSWIGEDVVIESSSSNYLLQQVARNVCLECRGLPLTIEDVGKSLRGRPIEEWKESLDTLRHTSARYQIFLSFRGFDTRYSFTGFLYQALCRERFKVFMDDEGLKRGDQISLSLVEAIQSSRLSIVVLSENYAYSTWCLDELVTIIECMESKINQLVWPIFYKVKPKDVRNGTGSFGLAMVGHETKFGKDSERVKNWKLALSKVGGMAGKPYTNGYEYEFIEKIVEEAKENKSRLYIQSVDMD